MDLRDKVDYDYSTTEIARCEVNQTYAQELSLRDYILDIEERIFNADFGDAFEDENERKLVSKSDLSYIFSFCWNFSNFIP